MKSRTIALLCLFAVVHAAAAEQWDWARVQELKSGTAIELSLAAAGPLTARFLSADDRSVTVTTDAGKTETFAKPAVTAVTLLTRGTRRGAMIGGGAGLVSGLVNKASAELLLALGGLLVGFGALVGRNFTIRKVIYRAPTVT